MLEFFDIFGTPIPYKDIKDFRIVQKEYIYRPAYEEYTYIEKSFLKNTQIKKFRFVSMIPYAAIIDESDRRQIISGKGHSLEENIGVEIFNDIRETIGDKLKLKAIKGKRYLCLNQTGRTFQVYLDEIPVLIKMEDGRIVEVDKDNPLFHELGNTVVPTINIVPALIITGKENYIFWGNGIQIQNIENEYKRLQIELSEYKQAKKPLAKERKTIEKKEITLPKLPKFTLKKNVVEKETDSESEE